MTGNNPRDRRITKGFLEVLRKWAPFRKLPEDAQRELAHMIWTDAIKAREHDSVEGATSYTYQELERRFGRDGFKRINNVAQAFHVGPWSKDRGTTKSYVLAPGYRVFKRQYVKSMVRSRKTDSFIDMSGRPIKTIPQPIAGKREDGSTIKLWGGIELTSKVPVNTDLLMQLYNQTWVEIRRYAMRKQSGNLFSDDTGISLEKLELRAEWAATLIVLANTDLGGRGWLPMRYREVPSGRLYAMDDNLQNCPSEVRRTALDGAWDYDIVNCHYTLLAQMAENLKLACPVIRHYLENTDAVRLAMMDYLGVDKGPVKTCLLALIYGASRSSSKKAAIGKTLGPEKAKQLLAMPAFKDLASEVKRIGDKVLELWPVKSGSLMNDAGCGIRQTENRKQKLAHLLQGAEALILKTTVDYLERQHPGNVVLLQHDGFTAVRQVATAPLEAHIKAQTGYQVTWKETRIQPSAGRDFSKMVASRKAA